MRSLVSTHTHLCLSRRSIRRKYHAPSQHNAKTSGVWPVLVGDAGEPIGVLSPIILYDYPQIAPKALAILTPPKSMRFLRAHHDADGG